MKKVIKNEIRISERQFRKFKDSKEAFLRYLRKNGFNTDLRVTNITPPNKRYVILSQEVIVDESENLSLQHKSDEGETRDENS